MGVFTDFLKKAPRVVTNPPVQFPQQSVVPPNDYIERIHKERNPYGGSITQEMLGGSVQQPQQPVQSPVTTPKVDTTHTMSSLASMLGPTPAEREAQMRRAQEGKAKMAAWTGLFDGLRHLGNLYYTTKGAPAQQFDNPYSLIDKNYEDSLRRGEQLAEYQRNYNTILYNLHRQGKQDELAERQADARIRYYDKLANAAGSRAGASAAQAEAAKARAENLREKTNQLRAMQPQQVARIEALTKKALHEAGRPYSTYGRRGGSGTGTDPYDELAANLQDNPDVIGPILQEEGLGFYDPESKSFTFVKNATKGMATTANERTRRQKGGNKSDYSRYKVGGSANSETNDYSQYKVNK